MSTNQKAGLILQHEEGGPPALFADWCERRGIAYEVCRVWEDGLPADPGNFPWICSLGSDHTPGKPAAPDWVDDEVAFLRAALTHDVPILGLCFGAQALATAAGASITRADPPEVGWFEIETADPDLIPPGPWLHFHYDQLNLPEGATELARSPAGTAAFRLGSSLGLQFHPEGTPEIANGWARSDRRELEELGISAARLTDEGERRGGESATAADQLFDSWWEGLEFG